MADMRICPGEARILFFHFRPLWTIACGAALVRGIIGFRILRVAGVEPGDRVRLFGLCSSAHLVTRFYKLGAVRFTFDERESHESARSSSTWVEARYKSRRGLDRPDVRAERAWSLRHSQV